MTWKAVRQFFAEHYDRRRDGRGELDAAFLALLHPPAARRRPGVEAGSAASLTWMQAPLFSLHRQQIRAHLLLGIWDTLVMGSIFSGLPMLTCTKRKDFVFKVAHRAREDAGLGAKLGFRGPPGTGSVPSGAVNT